MPQGRHPAQPARRENLPSPEEGPSPKRSTDSPSRKSSCHSKHFPTSKECHDMCEKDSQGSSSKHLDKPCSDRSSKDKESSKTLRKYEVSPSQMPSSTEWAEKQPYLEGPSLNFNASFQSRHSSRSRILSETDDQASFGAPTAPLLPTRLKVDHTSD